VSIQRLAFISTIKSQMQAPRGVSSLEEARREMGPISLLYIDHRVSSERLPLNPASFRLALRGGGAARSRLRFDPSAQAVLAIEM